MMAKFLLFAVFGAALFVGNYATDITNIDTFEAEIDIRLERVKELAAKVRNTREIYTEMTRERIDAINYMYASILKNIRDTIEEGVVAGIQHKRWFDNFECLLFSASEAERVLNEVYGNFPEDMKNLRDSNIAKALPYTAVTDHLESYVKELLKARGELSRTSDPERVKRILQEVSSKLKSVDGTLEALETKIFNLKFKYFEFFVDVCYIVEFALRIVPTRDVPNILKCMIF